ncbi:hypothetical protein BGZ60DRAFT_418706 [Tricladium varicosporioides]|nr:hypothetical protein BGZ60DRAFT_418706 [Hymenoscyphus varicosporioides]
MDMELDAQLLADRLADASPVENTNDVSMMDTMADPAPFTTSESLGASSSPALIPIVSNNRPGFKYKYPEAAPTPPGYDDAEWNKVYTAADSRFYNRNGKNSDKSRKFRQSGETYELALVMMKEKMEKIASGVAPRAAPKPKPAPTVKKPTVKKEPSASSRDVTPFGDKMSMSISEQIKAEGRARKAPSVAPSAPSASSKQGTPVPTVAPKTGSPPPLAAPKIDKHPLKKKGTAAPVKRPPKPKSENKPKEHHPTQSSGPRNNYASDSESNDGGEYCICRGPDDHRMMVNCEGGCDEWYHCSCINMNVEDAQMLLDRYICIKCQTDTMFTTWKRMCRYYNVGIWRGVTPCRKPARVTDDPPSKYCSDEHRNEFFKFVRERLVRQDDSPSMGGKLNGGEVRSILEYCQQDGQLLTLGKKPKLPIPEGYDTSRPIGFDYITEEEQQELREIDAKKHVIGQRIDSYKAQQRLLVMVHERAQAAAKHLGVPEKSICGYDNRLAVNEYEFGRWKESAEGKSAFATGKLGPRTAETKSFSARIYADHHTKPAIPDVADSLNNICLNKSCKKHTLWRIVHGQDYAVMQINLKKELDKLTKQAEDIVEDAETREATKEYHAHNTVEQLF